MNNKKDDYADFRLNLILKKVGQKLLLRVLQHAVPKPDSKSFYDHFSEGKEVSFKFFDSSQKLKLKSDISGASFDISLLYKLYIHGCPRVLSQSHDHWRTEGTFEFYLAAIKKVRNDLVHSTSPVNFEELNEKIDHLSRLFKNFCLSAKDKFEISDEIICKYLSEVETDLKALTSSPLSQSDIDDYLISEGVAESKARYKRLSYINPVDFFVGLEFSAKIEEIFVSLEIKELENYEEGQRIDFKALLKAYIKNNVSLLIVEGLAGSGKTTLSKFILSQWIDSTYTIDGLNEFSFILYLQCNNTYINSLNDLIVSIIPETSRKFHKNDLIESILCQKLLVVVDGIDEAHPGTKSVLKELFQKSYGGNIKFFCTTRPEKVPWIYRIKGDLSCGAISIVGIAKENRKDFIKKLHAVYQETIHEQKLYPLAKVNQTIERFSSTFLSNDLKLPLFLALSTYLCTVEPQKLEGINSVVSLYNELILALKDRLFTRSLSKCESSSLDCDEEHITEVIEECYSSFCDEALSSIMHNKETLSKEFLNEMRKHSSTIGLSLKDILSAFLVVKVVLTPLGIEEIVGFPHKGIKEFLGAKSIAGKLKRGGEIKTIFEDKSNALSPSLTTQLDLNTSLIKYQNLILYLSGILVMEKMLNEKYANEIIRLFRKAGVYRQQQWLQILTSLNFHYLACEFILMKFKKLEINDDHLDTLLSLLNKGCPPEIVIKIDTSDFNIIQKVKKILAILNSYECNLNLMLRQFFKSPRTRNGSDMVNILGVKNSRCNLTWFQGSLEEHGIRCLPESIRVLSLGVGTQKQAAALETIGQNSNILFLKIHVERCVNYSDLPKLREMFDFHLYLSGVKSTYNDVVWVTNVVSRLSANKKYGKIVFPSSEINSKTLNKLLKELQKLNLVSIGTDRRKENVGGIYLSSTSSISTSDEAEFKAFCHRIWGCKFAVISEEEIWKH